MQYVHLKHQTLTYYMVQKPTTKLLISSCNCRLTDASVRRRTARVSELKRNHGAVSAPTRVLQLLPCQAGSIFLHWYFMVRKPMKKNSLLPTMPSTKTHPQPADNILSIHYSPWTLCKVTSKSVDKWRTTSKEHDDKVQTKVYQLCKHEVHVSSPREFSMWCLQLNLHTARIDLSGDCVRPERECPLFTGVPNTNVEVITRKELTVRW